MIHKRSLWMLLLGLGIMMFLAVYYSAQAYMTSHSDMPQVKEGAMDLRQRDFGGDETVKLDGEWAFYWNRLLLPGEQAEEDGYLPVPGQWNKEGYPAKGAATYRAVVEVEPSSMMYGLRVSNAQMSSTVYVNGVQLGGSGNPSAEKASYKPENKPYAMYFPIEGDRAEIIVHVANYDFINGGITYSLHFGSMSGIMKLDKMRTGLDIVVIVALFMIGIYHLGVLLKRRRERGLFYFGLYCVVAAVSFACLSDKLFTQIFHGLPFELSSKIQLLAIHGSIIILILFLRSVCGAIIPAWFSGTVIALFGSFLLFGMVVPYAIYTHATFIFSGLQIVVYITVIWLLSVSREEDYGEYGRQSVRILILAVYALALCLIDNSLYINGLLPNNYLGNISMMVFAVLVSLLLSFRFSEAYRTIEAMSEKLLESDRLKDRFLLHTSHELQAPLNGIIHLSQSMLDSRAAGELGSGKEDVHLVIIHESAKRLFGLVGDILDLERIKQNDLRLQQAPVDVKVTVSVVLEMLQHLAAGKELCITNRIPDDVPPVHADEYRLRQVLYNVIGNAIKYTEQGTVDITAERLGDMLTVSVQDTGIGVDPAEWEFIFAPFARSKNNPDQGYGGVGLGLAITRELITLMDGEIYVESSREKRGARFTFHLPVSREAAVPGRRDRKSQLTAKRTGASLAPVAENGSESGDDGTDEHGTAVFTLLAVDDDPANLQVLIHLLAPERYHVLTASNGREALHLCRTNKNIDLVLLDVMMPHMSGYEVCREIRTAHPMFDLPVILMTAPHTPQDTAAGFAAGANDFIVKPLDGEAVRARVRTLLELKLSVRRALDAEMAFLQSQIKPHFLFNALTSIASICYTDSERAAKLIQHLGSYLRRSFDIPGTDMFVSLGEEIKLVQSYVEIEKARFDDRLVVEYEVDESLLDVSVLPLTIQPLVENAIRHGVMQTREGGSVKLTVRRDCGGPETDSGLPERLHVEVRDNGQGIAASRIEGLLDPERQRSGSGVGLINIHRRLLGFFGEGLSLHSREGQGTKVSFRVDLPKHNQLTSGE